MPIDDPDLKAALRRCARAQAWLELETNESRKELARQEVVAAKEAMQDAIQKAARTKAVVQDGPEQIREITMTRR